MKVLALLMTAVLAVNAITEKEQWESFKIEHGKSYKNKVEEKYRYSIFLETLQKITAHNARYEAGQETYFMGINKFSDLTPDEFSQRLGRPRSNVFQKERKIVVIQDDVEPPESIDWRNNGGCISEVVDQGTCHAGYAVAAAGAIEGQLPVANKTCVPLSIQQLIDCTGGSSDCSGGFTLETFNYLDNQGIVSAADYPFEAEYGQCRADQSKAVTKVSTAIAVVPGTENALKYSVGTAGPVAAAIYIKPLQNYKGGIFYDKDCYNDLMKTDHEVLVVGYGEENEEPFWIVKNSFGKSWGEDGYFRLARNEYQCGIALDATYPYLKD